jgi:hypothetical protein
MTTLTTVSMTEGLTEAEVVSPRLTMESASKVAT